MDVAISEVVVTDRGTPVARMLPIDSAPLLDQLVERGVLSRPQRAHRPVARGAARVRASGPVAKPRERAARRRGVTIGYFDSSAFVKLVVEEEGSDLAAALWDGRDAAVSSRLAYPEVRAALAAAARDQSF
ncbi:MAG TPA: hypothetical protein VF317_13165 [Dermatophilaceae bacterium]|jgi:antitoxin (DNA-binding transcriptional repressor) of toxin-antitoxin stability system